MVGLLVVLFVAVFGLHKNSRIPIFYAKLVMDPERFERHPWGRVAFQSLFKSLSQTSLSSSTVSVHGFAHVLQIWALEYIPHLGVMCGGKREGRVPLLQWVSRSCRGIELADVFEADKKTTGDNKVRVVHLLEKPYEEIYPEWPGAVRDPKVDRMIRDILDGILDEEFWAVPAPTKRKAKEGLGRDLRSSKKPRTTVECSPKGEESRKAKETPKAKPSRNETLELEAGMTLAEFQTAAREREKEKLEKKWRKEFEEKKQGEERNMMVEMLQSMKEMIDVMRFDHINMTERVARLEEKRVDQAVTDERIRRLEEAMGQQNSINQRLLKALETKSTENVLSLEAPKEQPSDVDASTGDKLVRKSLLD